MQIRQNSIMENSCKDEKDEVQLKDLPHDLITEHILKRLPIKPLIRFKSVSKQWYSTLSSPHFASSHFYFSYPSSPSESLLIRSKNKFQLFTYEDENNVQLVSENRANLANIVVDFDAGNETTNLIGSCNGLVCLASNSGCLFIIWNPINREFRKYLSTDIDSLARFGCTVSWGFGYVSEIDDYKVVRIYKHVSNQSVRVDVFSLKLNKWRKIDSETTSDFSELRRTERLHRAGVLVNECLYWMGEPPMIDYMNRRVLYFDLALEVFGTYPAVNAPLAAGFATGECCNEFLCVVKGCLSQYGRFVLSGDGLISVLKHPGETEFIRISKDLQGSVSKILIGFAKTDRFFTLHYGRHELHLGIMDLSSQPMEYTPVTSLEKTPKIEIISYFPSLISLVSVTASDVGVVNRG